MAAGVNILGPYAPKDFAELAATRTALDAAMTADLPSGTVVACEPVVVLGNVFLVVYTSS